MHLTQLSTLVVKSSNMQGIYRHSKDVQFVPFHTARHAY